MSKRATMNNVNTIHRTGLTLAASLALLGLSSVAGASEEFPTELREAAGLDCTPVCSVCHTQDPGSSGTASTEFALAMVDAGLTAGKPETLAPAWEAVSGEEESGAAGAGADLDFDFPCQAEVKYGCGVEPTSQKPSGSQGLVWPVLLAAFGLLVAFRRRVVD